MLDQLRRGGHFDAWFAARTRHMLISLDGRSQQVVGNQKVSGTRDDLS
jgi:hypothetical protein